MIDITNRNAAQIYHERKGKPNKHSEKANRPKRVPTMMNHPASSAHKKTAIGEWDRGERSFDAYPPPSFPVRANKEDTEGQRLQQLDQKVGNAAMLVYGMMAAGAVVEVFLLGTLQQWW